MAATQRAGRDPKISEAVIASSSTVDREITQERVFDAPRELVWKAFTDPKHLDQWWGPNGYRNDTHAMAFRVGGEWRYDMLGPDGKVWDNWIRYEEITAPERLVYSHGGDGSSEPQFHVTLTFTSVGPRKTKVTMRSVFPSREVVAQVMKFGAVEGGAQTLARLAGFLPSLEDGSAARLMVVSRVLDAPRALVFEAWSSPQAVTRWWGPKGFTLAECTMDFRTGGAYRMAMRGPDGSLHPFHGHFREVVPNERIVFHAIIELTPVAEVLTTVTFSDEPSGKTLLTVTQEIPADPAASAGQRQGWSETLEKLGASLKAA